MQCYACDQEAAANCPRCGNDYCGDHAAGPGEALCEACVDPVNATPSNVVFRTSLVALLIASVFALWLLVRPPGDPGGSSQASQPPPTPAPISTVTPAPSTPTAEPGEPSGAASPSPGGSPAPTPTPVPVTPTPAPTEVPVTEYTVVEDDTWYSIAGAFGVDAEALAAANGRTLDDFIRIGETLVIP